MKKIILNGLLIVSMVCTSLLVQIRPVLAAEQTVTFTDIKGHWAKAAIDTAVKSGYFKGYADGTFKPNGTVTRAEFAALLSRATKVQAENAQTNVFADLAGHWSEEEVNRAVSLGYVNPSDYPNGFKPSTPITRMEIAKWMSSGLAAGDADYKQALQDTATTVLPVKEYFKPGISQSQAPYIAVSLGTKLMSGYPDGSFGLTKQATRAEASAILLRLNTVSQQPAASFVGLNELREVGTKRTNMESISPFTTGRSSFNDIAGKTFTYKNKRCIVKLNHFIIVDAQAPKNPKGIYAPLFFDEDEIIDRLDRRGIYRAYVEVTIYPLISPFSIGDYFSDQDSGLFVGSRTVTDNLKNKYGYNTLPYDEPQQFFANYMDGKGVTLWQVKFLEVTQGKKGLTMDDGTWLYYELKED
ncbi:S-layer homology domain-containing protein [Paenibacillus sp. MMS20-IR301]|uniref:S-layer homology domain-containing protein n=1 Tax=Paenibacillus sp. MMS20-IR301 TaxID=2895946 RepID=UPI0028EFEBCC|nr:S-layer homology domain-containing protein [Paenibacillus sp. MMS20-IR301]WNS41066.1 S-layer homology domain-containing protein [Paenibacillus sp. MMS20-IR301]